LKPNKKFGQFATSVDRLSAVEAMTKSKEIGRNIERSTEKHWRCLSKADGKFEAF
jgi:hypothetical protein